MTRARRKRQKLAAQFRSPVDRIVSAVRRLVPGLLPWQEAVLRRLYARHPESLTLLSRRAGWEMAIPLE